MSDISVFLANNYIWFLVGGIVLIFALIGYIVDSKNIQFEKPKTIKADVKDSKHEDDVEQLKEEIKDKDITLNQATGNVNIPKSEVKTAPTNTTETLDTSVKKDDNKAVSETPSDTLIKEDNNNQSTFQK
jgi:preprotein translocase subunit SecF